MDTSSRCEHCGQSLPKTTDWKSKRFKWGICIAAVTLFPFAILIGATFGSISSNKTTGLGAVAGGFSEFFATCGILAIVGFSLCGIVLLTRSLDRQKPVRVLVSVLSIGWLGFLLLLTSLSVLSMRGDFAIAIRR